MAIFHGAFFLHVGHFRNLREPKGWADVLVVTVTEDRQVNNGPHRPTFGDGLRCEALAAPDAVDYAANQPRPARDDRNRGCDPMST